MTCSLCRRTFTSILCRRTLIIIACRRTLTVHVGLLRNVPEVSVGTEPSQNKRNIAGSFASHKNPTNEVENAFFRGPGRDGCHGKSPDQPREVDDPRNGHNRPDVAGRTHDPRVACSVPASPQGVCPKGYETNGGDVAAVFGIGEVMIPLQRR
jgi:hypothetical protein